MRISLTLCLPRDSSTLSVIRHIAASALNEMGVETETIEDVILALTEAAANVVKHSGAEDKYEVDVVIEDQVCRIRVTDAGHGFDTAALDMAMAGPSDEQGRGLALMAALVDSVRFESRPEAGTVVHLVKELPLRPGAAMERLVDR